ncbi:hypothetical protein RB597_010324 [Gaeumannomyces tritici]
MLVRDLVDETSFGPQYINATIALDTDKSIMRSIADDFIKVMVHPSLLDCLSVGTYVGELYHIAGGANGAATLDFIANYCEGLLLSYKRIPKIHTPPTVDEVLSTWDDFLPSTDFRQPHFCDDPVQRYLDTHFRLLRYDTFYPFVDFLHQALLSFTGGVSPLNVQDGNVRAYVYYAAAISHFSVDDKRGFESHISFSSPHYLRQKSAGERRTWWEQSRRLEQGAMVCFVCTIDGQPTPLLFVVSDKSTNPSQKHNLVSEAHRGTISTRLATPERKDLELLTRIYHYKINGILIDLPDLIPATFKPILENLQDMMLHTIPCRKWIIPDLANTWNPPDTIPPPRYARGTGFAFRLDPILQGRVRSLALSATASKDDATVLDRLVAETGLDRGQAAAFVAALTTEYALLQGPPGTGKSYLGVKLLQVLLACKSSAGLGPIVVICYTNHALDQFLHHLRAAGISRIIRIGGRSQSEDLDDCNLAEVSRRTPKCRNESQILGKTYSELDEQRRSLGHRLAGLHALRKEPSSTLLKRYLERNRDQIHAQFFPDEQEVFVTVGDPISVWLGKSWGPSSVATSAAATEELLEDLGRRATRDVNSLSRSERRLLYQSWLDEIRMEQTDLLYEEIRHTEVQRSRIDAVHNEVNRRVLLNADVIGITTTGLAKDVATLRRLRAKVVICEEAAEVLEPHLISALMPGVEHLIQIGDHQQLRPQITCRALSAEEPSGELYQLDRSQFERLAVGEPGLAPLPVAQLSVQRRMRPQISQLIRQTMYPRLEDHDIVKHLPNVVGMRNNVFWLTHNYAEDVADEDKRLKSHGNA